MYNSQAFFCQKRSILDRITVFQEEDFFNNKFAKELNNLCLSIVKNLNISNFGDCEFLSVNNDHPTLKAIVKLGERPSDYPRNEIGTQQYDL